MTFAVLPRPGHAYDHGRTHEVSIGARASHCQEAIFVSIYFSWKFPGFQSGWQGSRDSPLARRESAVRFSSTY